MLNLLHILLHEGCPSALRRHSSVILCIRSDMRAAVIRTKQVLLSVCWEEVVNGTDRPGWPIKHLKRIFMEVRTP